MLRRSLATLQGLDPGTDDAAQKTASVDEEIVFVLNYLGAGLRHRGRRTRPSGGLARRLISPPSPETITRPALR